MSKVFIPAGYHSCLSLYDTQKAISLIKRVFEDTLCGNLNLSRVSAPLFVEASTGLNDDLNGVERPVSFDVPDIGRDAQVVHSLAKWKRLALHRYDFRPGKGLYTDMNAIRRDETLDNIHSIYVDQWDWEKVITPEERNVAYLKATVQSIVDAIVSTQRTLRAIYPQLNTVPDLVPEVTFITTQELEDRYPELTPKERENAITRECGTVFLMQIGGKLRSGQPHDGRAPDYSPVIGQFYNQNPDDKIEIGAFPIVNVYANLHLKRTRFFIMMYHVNAGSGKSNYFLAPHYPINPRMIKFGLSWNFFD